MLFRSKVGLIGRNGAGKSTLFKLLSNEDTPDSGEVIVTQGLRVALRDYPARRTRKHQSKRIASHRSVCNQRGLGLPPRARSIATIPRFEAIP